MPVVEVFGFGEVERTGLIETFGEIGFRLFDPWVELFEIALSDLNVRSAFHDVLFFAIDFAGSVFR